MKNSMKLIFAAIAFYFVLSAFTVFEVKAQVVGPLNEILKRMDTHHKALLSLQADVTMQKYDSLLGETDVTVGNMKYLPKTRERVRYIRLDWTKPVAEQILVVGNEYTLFRPRIPQVIIGKTDNAKNNAKVGGALSFMSMSKTELQANYATKYLGIETVKGGVMTQRIELTPKKATSYKLAYLWVDKDGMPVMAQIVEKNNDSTTVLLSNLIKNETLKGEDFAINYPKDLKPIKG